ncbi:unnamed protein product [Orchesella dallaii]|uniref:Uncharacterized protein n=1 Tax=Orchesella dallaii TaxID=48710 RepID=A0ABP1R4H9_9HEXA
MNSDQNVKKLEEFLLGQFRGLKTYADGGDPRRYILPSLMLKYVSSALLTSDVFLEKSKDALRNKLRGYNCMQTGHQDIFQEQLTTAEHRLLNTFPVVWMSTLISGQGLDEIIEILELTDADIQRKEAAARDVIQIN